VVAGSEQGLGPGGSHDGFAEGPGDPGAALAGGAGFGLAGGLAGPGREPGPGDQVPGSGEPGHVGPDLGDELLGAGLADAGDLIELVHLPGARGA